MGDVQEHYSRLLAKNYSWMFGVPFAAKVAEQRAILAEVLPRVEEGGAGLAVDLGSGPGFQTVALAEMGYSRVLAVDTSEALLGELKTQSWHASIETVCADLLGLGELVAPSTVAAVVCMGDTVTHLGGVGEVERLLGLVYDALVPGGRFVLTYRDLSVEVMGLDRFIPVRSDVHKVMTCFLEFDRPETVLVHDLVYSREGEQWGFEKSSYRKLRLAVDWLESAMGRVGFGVERGQAGRLVRLVGAKAVGA